MRILSSAGFDVVAAAANLGEVVHDLIADSQSILLVLHASGFQDAMVAQIKLFRAKYPAARIALLQEYGRMNNINIIAAFQAGVDAYFVEPSHFTLIKNLELVMQGETVLPAAAMSSSLHDSDEMIASDDREHEDRAAKAEGKYALALSEQQQSILRCLLEGHSNREIAMKLGIGEATAKTHVKNTLRKIGAHNRTQAAVWAMSNKAALTSKVNEADPARPPIVPEPSLHGHVVPVQSEAPGDAIASPSNPSELAKRAANAMNADLAQKAFAKKRHQRSKRTLAGKTDRRDVTTSKVTHERDDKE
ncbi:DNA-binding response regulator, NarL/FixJ family, contains REC and HTH domains [Rhizobiales bacterium GAS113]|nr:DNA-binding response regulator, NarL/FixJ family, contains REC and HTH domains [Rhizobiales bacterium GAS113]